MGDSRELDPGTGRFHRPGNRFRKGPALGWLAERGVVVGGYFAGAGGMDARNCGLAGDVSGCGCPDAGATRVDGCCILWFAAPAPGEMEMAMDDMDGAGCCGRKRVAPRD